MDRVLGLLIGIVMCGAMCLHGADVSLAAPKPTDSPEEVADGGSAFLGGGGKSSAKTDGDAVEIEDSRESYSSSGGRRGSSGRSGSGSGSDSEGSARFIEVLTAAEAQAQWDEICYGTGTCVIGGSNTSNNRIVFEPADPVDPVEPVPGAPVQVVMITDLERFLPATAELAAEPDGWAVVGVPTNLWTRVEPVVVDGELFGDLAQVRFTPQLYRWQYGDGAVQSTATGGASWEALGQEALTATATGHVYREKGDLEASVTVVWSAEYRIGGGAWLGVAGAVSSTTPPSRVLVVEERTVLTAR